MTRDRKKIALTPPMGWNSIHQLGWAPDEISLREMADALLINGMKDLGYEYLIIDDGWSCADRDSDGNLVPDPDLFPSGMKSLVSYIHSLGLKVGIHLTCGYRSNAGKPGSLGYEKQDARRIAEWNFDYLKYEFRECKEDNGERNVVEDFIKMSNELKLHDRDILFNMCDYGMSSPWLWAAEYADMWRVSTNVKDIWDGEKGGGWSFNKIIDYRMVYIPQFAGPGHWNNPDYLLTGLKGQADWLGRGLTDIEYRSQFSLWAMLAAPLITTNDLRNMDEYTKETLTNKEIININQDSLGIQGKRVYDFMGKQIFIKILNKKSYAVALYNSDDREYEYDVNFATLKLDKKSRYKIRDLWKHEDIGIFNRGFSRKVAPHECVVLKLSHI